MTICETLHSISTKNHGRRVYVVQNHNFPVSARVRSAGDGLHRRPHSKIDSQFSFQNKPSSHRRPQRTDRHYPFFPSLLRSPRRPSNKGTKLPISDNLAPETVSPAAPRGPSASRPRPSTRRRIVFHLRTDGRREGGKYSRERQGWNSSASREWLNGRKQGVAVLGIGGGEGWEGWMTRLHLGRRQIYPRETSCKVTDGIWSRHGGAPN